MISRILLIALAGLSIAACSQEEAPEFCSDHALFHEGHAASNAILSVEMTADGRVVSEVQLPTTTEDRGLAQRTLMSRHNVYELQTTTACSDDVATQEFLEGGVVAGYTSNCGADNKLSQVDVLLFDSFPNLNEVDVSVVTPVTQKHFLINRQCASAIFRFE